MSIITQKTIFNWLGRVLYVTLFAALILGALGTQAAPQISIDSQVHNLTNTSAQFRGFIDDFGGQPKLEVYFEYKKAGTSNWSQVGTTQYPTTNNLPLTVNYNESNLMAGQEYDLRFCFDDGASGTCTTEISFMTTGAGGGSGGGNPTIVVPAVIDASHSNVAETSATVSAKLDDLGNAASVVTFFNYREAGTTSWTVTGASNTTTTGGFTQNLGNLTPATAYEYQACAENTAGIGCDTFDPSTHTFTTDASSTGGNTGGGNSGGGSSSGGSGGSGSGSTPIRVATGSVIVNNATATLGGEITRNNRGQLASVSFDYGTNADDLDRGQSAGVLASTGSFTATVTNLLPNTTYYYRAVAQYGNRTQLGDVESFTTSTTGQVLGISTGVSAPANLTTLPAEQVGGSHAFFRGTYTSPTGGEFFFRYGQDGRLTETTPRLYRPAGANQSFFYAVSNLNDDANYHYQICDDAGCGLLQGFKTFKVWRDAEGNLIAPPSSVVRTTTTTRSTTPVTPVATRSETTIPVVTTTTTSTNNEDLVLSLFANKSSISTSDLVQYTLSFTNTSDEILSDVQFAVMFPEQFDIVSVGDGFYSALTSTVHVREAVISPNESDRYVIVARLADTDIGSLANPVAVRAEAEYDTDGRVAVATTQVSTLMLVDEVTDNASFTASTGNSGFLPDSFPEWMLVLMLVVIIGLLVQNMLMTRRLRRAYGTTTVTPQTPPTPPELN